MKLTVFGTSASARESALKTVINATTPPAVMQQARAAGSATPLPSTSLYVRYAAICLEVRRMQMP